MRIQRNATWLVASTMVLFGGFIVPHQPVLSWAKIFSTDAQASETIVARADVCSWNDVSWRDMSDDEKKAWETLGWTWQMWDAEEAGPQPPSSSKGWVELSEDERAAARRLGYKRRTWDADNCMKR